MKITIVQGAFLPVPALKGGAVERAWHGLGRAFSQKGHQVTHLSRRFPGLPNVDSADGVTHVRVSGFDTPSQMWKLKLCDLRYSLQVRKALPKADIVVTNTFWLPLLLRNDSRGKVYVHVARIPKGQMRFYRHVARLQAVSKATAAAILAECPACEPIVRVLPYHLDDKWFRPSNSVSRSDRKLLFVGRVHPEKGLDILMDAIGRVPESVDLAVEVVGPSDVAAGGGGEDFLANLKQAAGKSGRQVQWTGPIYDVDKLIDAYDGARVFLYPSVAEKGETFGVAPLEAMARGCIPVISSLDCFLDFAEPGRNCVQFDHRSNAADHLSNGIQEAVAADAEIACQARKTAERFHVDRVSDLYLDDFRSLVNA